jgi:hypothetical protein
MYPGSFTEFVLENQKVFTEEGIVWPNEMLPIIAILQGDLSSLNLPWAIMTGARFLYTTTGIPHSYEQITRIAMETETSTATERTLRALMTFDMDRFTSSLQFEEQRYETSLLLSMLSAHLLDVLFNIDCCDEDMRNDHIVEYANRIFQHEMDSFWSQALDYALSTGVKGSFTVQEICKSISPDQMHYALAIFKDFPQVMRLCRKRVTLAVQQELEDSKNLCKAFESADGSGDKLCKAVIISRILDNYTHDRNVNVFSNIRVAQEDELCDVIKSIQALHYVAKDPSVNPQGCFVAIETILNSKLHLPVSFITYLLRIWVQLPRECFELRKTSLRLLEILDESESDIPLDLTKSLRIRVMEMCKR